MVWYPYRFDTLEPLDPTVTFSSLIGALMSHKTFLIHKKNFICEAWLQANYNIQNWLSWCRQSLLVRPFFSEVLQFLAYFHFKNNLNWFTRLAPETALTEEEPKTFKERHLFALMLKRKLKSTTAERRPKSKVGRGSSKVGLQPPASSEATDDPSGLGQGCFIDY